MESKSLADVPKLSRTEREDFKETSDPALERSADRGAAKLLDYTQLYELWERQQWLTQELDFSQDRVDWHERIPEDERYRRMYGLSSVGRATVRINRGASGRRRGGSRVARGAQGCDADLPRDPGRRRGPSRALLRAVLQRGRGA